MRRLFSGDERASDGKSTDLERPLQRNWRLVTKPGLLVFDFRLSRSLGAIRTAAAQLRARGMKCPFPGA